MLTVRCRNKRKRSGRNDSEVCGLGTSTDGGAPLRPKEGLRGEIGVAKQTSLGFRIDQEFSQKQFLVQTQTSVHCQGKLLSSGDLQATEKNHPESVRNSCGSNAHRWAEKGEGCGLSTKASRKAAPRALSPRPDPRTHAHGRLVSSALTSVTRPQRRHLLMNTQLPGEGPPRIEKWEQKGHSSLNSPKGLKA